MPLISFKTSPRDLSLSSCSLSSVKVEPKPVVQFHSAGVQRIQENRVYVFKSEKAADSLLLVGPRARELPSRARHTVGRTRRRAAWGQPLLGALHCGRSYTRVVRTALPAPAPTQPPQTKAQGHLRPRASVARGVSSLADFSPGATRGREKVPSPSPPH